MPLTALGFALLSGSGFVGARLGLPHAGPFAFLALRFALAALLLAGLARLVGAPWPQSWRAGRDYALAGLLGVGLFSLGVFHSIAGGVPAAVSALIIALQPLLIAVLAPWLLGERLGLRQGLGLLLGLAGVALVLAPGQGEQPLPVSALAASFFGLFALCAGNLYQKARCAAMHPFSGGSLQCLISTMVCAIGWWWYEPEPVRWHSEFVLALSWMSVIVSAGAVSLLVLLIRQGQISQVAGWFYLLPVAAALLDWLLFGHGLSGSQWLGIVIAGSGVWWTTRH
ncbi:DMT family transporter [Dechloromonas sp. ZY10]|uniref:DMT family transporter n=1 Tax=Dechloromonas aquae TaxID=2664436 RepID=UPI003528832C